MGTELCFGLCLKRRTLDWPLATASSGPGSPGIEALRVLASHAGGFALFRVGRRKAMSLNDIADEGFASLRRCEGLNAMEIPPSGEVDARWCLRFLRAIRDAAFATDGEDGLPGVLVIDVMAVDDERLYLLSPRGKAFRGDVMREGFVVIVAQTPDYRTCRFRGYVKRIPDDLQRGLVIDRACTGCGEGCIAEGDPCSIDQEHCIRCGICQEVCSAGAVKRPDV